MIAVSRDLQSDRINLPNPNCLSRRLSAPVRRSTVINEVDAFNDALRIRIEVDPQANNNSASQPTIKPPCPVQLFW